MKYKIGDEVKIKENEKYMFPVQEQLLECNHTVTIYGIHESYYVLKEVSCYWEENYIEGLVSVLSCKEFFSPITIRFELMEL